MTPDEIVKEAYEQTYGKMETYLSSLPEVDLHRILAHYHLEQKVNFEDGKLVMELKLVPNG